MKRILVLLLAATVTLAAGAKPRVDAAQLNQDIDFCYGVSAMAASTVELRAMGKTLDEVLASRRQALDDATYPLIADITTQVYEKDLTDTFVVAASANVGCLEAKGRAQSFRMDAQQQCPRVGLMRAEVDALRRKGMSAEQTVAQLQDRYGDTRTALGESLADVAAKEPRADEPDNGRLDNFMCMVLAITGN